MIRVFVGTEPNLELPYKVLQHSILSRTRERVEFFKMDGPHWDVLSRGLESFKIPGGMTGFSFRRWMIPYVMRYQERAIYLDADQVVLADIGDLWRKPDLLPAAGNVIWAAKKGHRFLYSVMVIDCVAASDHHHWQPDHLFSDVLTKIGRQKLMAGGWIRPTPVDIGYEWNHIDYHVPGVTKLLHFSDLRRQPWFQPAHPHTDVWLAELRAAMIGRSVTEEDVEKARSIYAKKRGLHPENYAKIVSCTRRILP